MERLLLAEFLPQAGHSNLFNHTELLLKSNFEILSLKSKFQNSEYDPTQIYYYKEKYKSYILTRIDYTFYSIRTIRKVLKTARAEKINKIICITYDEIALFLYASFIPKTFDIYIMHHNNLDKFEKSFVAKHLFLLFKHRFKHIVQCGFMAKYLQNNYAINNVLVWPHPLNPVQKKAVCDIDCVGISNSNDEGTIESILLLEKETQVFRNKNIKVLLRSKVYAYDDGYLKIINGRLSNDEYNDYINRAKFILIPFSNGYKMRMSGTLVDALTNKKTVIATNIPLIMESSKKYPDVVKVFNISTFADTISVLNNNETINKQFEDFADFHSDRNLVDIMSNTLRSSFNNEEVQCKYDF